MAVSKAVTKSLHQIDTMKNKVIENKVIDEDLEIILEERYYPYNKCGKKCYVVSAVSLFLFLIFVALPAGAFLIIHGRHTNELAFILGGAAVVCSPIIAVIIITIVFCVYRRKRQATFTSVSTAKV